MDRTIGCGPAAATRAACSAAPAPTSSIEAAGADAVAPKLEAGPDPTGILPLRQAYEMTRRRRPHRHHQPAARQHLRCRPCCSPSAAARITPDRPAGATRCATFRASSRCSTSGQYNAKALATTVVPHRADARRLRAGRVPDDGHGDHDGVAAALTGWFLHLAPREVTELCLLMWPLRSPRLSISTLALTLLIFVAGARPAHAQGFISPFIGYNFGGDSGCPEITNCEDKNLNWGVGSEGSDAYLALRRSSPFSGLFRRVARHVIERLHLYGQCHARAEVRPCSTVRTLAGLGLIKTKVELTVPGVLNSNNNDFGWNTGGWVVHLLRRPLRHPRRYPLLPCLLGARAPGFRSRGYETRLRPVCGALTVKF